MPGHLQMLGLTLSGGVLLAASFVPALAGPSGAALTGCKGAGRPERSGKGQRLSATCSQARGGGTSVPATRRGGSMQQPTMVRLAPITGRRIAMRRHRPITRRPRTGTRDTRVRLRATRLLCAARIRLRAARLQCGTRVRLCATSVRLCAACLRGAAAGAGLYRHRAALSDGVVPAADLLRDPAPAYYGYYAGAGYYDGGYDDGYAYVAGW